ncbi:hypothetical protein BDN70DRAFT_847141 [Pholiota conissans]|uniref:PAS domain-containing protein n=1 Tax=Pholiota conissans TaxID=109636 RepID=A0A9P5ZE36_9AGAR|nr:hypothetical protein BDN70DRAFT_847141 [Pholiota conissans]
MATAPTPCLSFIGIVDFSEKARWLFMTESVTDLLGFEPHELIGRPSLELVHPDEFPRVKQLHYDTIQQDKAAVLVYLRMKHKDPFRGYVLCGVCRTVVHNVLVGSVSFASPGAKALHNASTAQEITVITPSAANFEFRRWHDPSPMPPSPIPEGMATINIPPSPSPSSAPAAGASSPTMSAHDRLDRLERRGSHSTHRSQPSVSPTQPYATMTTSPTHANQPVISFSPLPSKSFRTAFILDRFSTDCTILYASNDLLISSVAAIGRSFFDFVSKRDEEVVRSWISCVKGWGVNEKGQPSDGGFGFGKFMVCAGGRDSADRMPDPQPTPRSRNRHGSQSTRASHAQSSFPASAHGQRPSRYARGSAQAHSPTHGAVQDEGERFEVDAIFSAHSDGLMVILRRAS